MAIRNSNVHPNNIFAIRNSQNSCYSLFLENVGITTIRKCEKYFLLVILPTQSRNDKVDVISTISTSWQFVWDHTYLSFILISTLLTLYFLGYNYSLFQMYNPNNIFTNPNSIIFTLFWKSLFFLYSHILIPTVTILAILTPIQTYPK